MLAANQHHLLKLVLVRSSCCLGWGGGAVEPGYVPSEAAGKE